MNRLVWFALLVALPTMAQQKQPAPAPPKPSVVKPLLPPKSSPVENQEIDKRRDRMKQRDSEIDRMLKERQRKEAERSREQRRH